MRARSKFAYCLALASAACAVGVLLPVAPAYALPPAVANIKIELDGSAISKTMAVTWSASTYSPFDSYEFYSASGSDTIDWYDYTTNKSQTSYALPGWGNKSAPGSFNLGATYSVGMDIAESPGVAGPKTLANVKMVSTPTVTATSATASSISISWTAASTSDPFVEYDLYLAPSTYTGSLGNCYIGWEPTKTTNTRTLSTVPAACGGGSVSGATNYRVGVRTIQKVGNPSVWTKVGEASVTTPASLPAQCTTTNEAFCAVYPNAFVKNATWPTAEQGQAVTLNGANTKYGPRLSGTTWNTSNVTALFDQIDSAGPAGFNAVRLNLDWGMFQYKNSSGQVVVDPAALTELDTVIDSAAGHGLYVILVPMHLRQPGSVCTSSSSRLFNATFNIPRWAWDKLDSTLPTGGCNSYPSAFDDLVDNAVSLPEARTYFRTLAGRYSDYSTSSKASRSKNVVAFDLVNEMTADGADISVEQAKILSAYQSTISDLRANTAATKKIMIVGAAHGDTSYAQNIGGLQALSSSGANIVLSFHDYFGGAPNGGTLTGTSYGLGYSASGFVSSTYQERSDGSTGAARTYTYANEASQHRTYLEQMAGWASQASLPLYIGEYGVYNACFGNVQSEANSYAIDTKALYDSVKMTVGGTSVNVPLSRTWWAHGFSGSDSAMDLRRMSSGCAAQASGTYFAHAFYL